MKRSRLIIFLILMLATTMELSAQHPVMIRNFFAETDSLSRSRLNWNACDNNLVLNGTYYCFWGGPLREGYRFMAIDGSRVEAIGTVTGMNLTGINGTVYFSGYDPTNGFEFWKSDGTGAGTMLIKNTVTAAAEDDCQRFTLCNNRILFFKKYVGVSKGVVGNLYDLLASDGTTAGTVKVRTFSDHNSAPIGGWNLNGTFVFVNAYPGKPNAGHELWKSNGTSKGTAIIKDFYPGSGYGWPLMESLYATYARSSNMDLFACVADGKLYFRGNDGVKGEELCRTDATAAGTVRLTDINPSGNASPTDIVRMGNALYFAAKDATSGVELWKYSLTSGTASRVKDIYAGSGSSDPCFLTVMGSEQTQYLLFAARTANEGVELWRSDGTEAGTCLVKDINAGAGDSRPNSYISTSEAQATLTIDDFASKPAFTTLNGKIYFPAYTPSLGHELYESDGTEAGTRLVSDIWQGADGSGFGYSSKPRYLAAVGDMLIFLCYTPDFGWEWWRYDPPQQTPKNMADAAAPAACSLENYPNPFNPSTTVRYMLPEAGLVTVRVFDALGREMTVLQQGWKDAGMHAARFDGSALPSGMYVCRMETSDGTLLRAMTLAK